MCTSQMSKIKMNKDVTIGYKVIVMFTLRIVSANVNIRISD